MLKRELLRFHKDQLKFYLVKSHTSIEACSKKLQLNYVFASTFIQLNVNSEQLFSSQL